MNIVVVGLGRMGRAVTSVAGDLGHTIVNQIDVDGDAAGRPLADAVRATAPDVVIEFTQPEAAEGNVRTVLALGVPVVSGTTGWDPRSLDAVAREAGASLLVAANFSIGIAVMKRLVRQAGLLLRNIEGFEPALVERHHRSKRDAPSGTARMLASVLEEAGAASDLPVAALRHGNQPGEHTLIFEGHAETLTITHSARSPEVFALGAIRAAEWLYRDRPIGLVDFDRFLERAGTWTNG